AFDDEVIDRLFVLNAQRAAEEAKAAQQAKAVKKRPKAKAKPKPADGTAQAAFNFDAPSGENP
ncbi:MAG: hypothetical protein KC613_16530, partial [Myxococcales bacterium]|nr:hypothetical protein [Myxococcales bacterium]